MYLKGLYIAKVDEEYSLDIGVYKKIQGQINAFKNKLDVIDFIRLKNKDIYFNNILLYKSNIRYFAYRQIYKGIKKISLDYDFAYVRYAKGNYNFYKTIKLLNKKGIKVIVEIPTYPYLDETNMKTLRGIIDLLIDKIITAKIHKYIYRISTTSTDDKIFGVQTIRINNGIDLNTFPAKSKKKRNLNKINLIGIGNLAKWHGYDRVIKGLSKYYELNNLDKQVHFYIIGEGSEKNELEKISNSLGVSKYVHFLGAKNGQELDKIFDEMDIGVSSLALFRAGGGHDPIKTKEFISRGLPVILGYNDRLVDMTLPYIFKVDETDREIDINTIINRYKNSNSSIEEIRKYAEENLSWNSQIEKIIKNI